MELPKNITQIGEVGRDCKIYIEDYVISYMKQLNQVAQDKYMAVALYGKRKEENGIAYHFLYGACKLDFLQREVRHLSQAQQQEIEKLRRKYFPDLVFLGYRILNGEMIEGIHLSEQGICRYIGGYAQFYEKNDMMLAYMLDIRDKAEPEYVDQTKYEEVKKRQEERRVASGHFARGTVAAQDSEQHGVAPVSTDAFKTHSLNLQKMRLVAVGVFALLCLWGIGTFREDELKNGQTNGEDVIAASGSVEEIVEQKDTLLMEDKLEQALLEENQSTETEQAVQNGETVMEERASLEEQPPLEEQPSLEEQVAETSESVEQAINDTDEVTKQESSAPVSQNKVDAVAYVIQPGDTLITICLRQYNSDSRLEDICSLNNITDPDDIQEGQVIMLPQ